MNAYVARPEGNGPFPAVMVFQEAYGVNHHIRNLTDKIAKEGYVAIAPELFHRTAPAGFEAGYTEFEKVKPHLSTLSTEGFEADVQATYDWLKTQQDVQKDNIGCIGFCMGGRVSFVANTLLPLKAAISFYAGGLQGSLDRINNLQSPHLFFWGGKDQHIKPEHRDEAVIALRASGKEFINVEVSYADHGFFCDERASYNPQAAAEAWGMVKAFFINKFGLSKA